MMEPLVYLNGQLLPQSQARLTLHDAGFVMGATVTDLCRTFAHRLFRWPEHLRRFRQGCEAADIPQPVSDDELDRQAQELVAHNATLLGPDDDLALVVFATPGPVGYYLGQPWGAGEGQPTLGMHTFVLPRARYAPLFLQGARLAIPPVRQMPASCLDPRIKQRSRLHWWLAERQARRLQPGAAALLLNEQGQVTETATANFLLVRRGSVLSPPRSTILPGVSLEATQQLCGSLGIPFGEEPLDPAACHAADEALLTSTPYGVAGVRAIDGFELTWPGPVCQRLQEAWNALVGLDIRRQLLSNR
jgi:branched-chain amino acid aminotransferase